MPAPSIPGHEHVARFFGLRLRLVVAIVGAGLAGGALGAASLGALDVVESLIGPERWGGAAQIVVLGAIGVVIAVLVGVLGRPADVELLVDNIHVPRTGDAHPARLRSLLPISLLCIGAGGTLGPEAPVVTTSGTVAHRGATRAALDEPDVRVVALTGMAAGLAVLFGAPLGAALFALEIPHRRGIQYHEALVPAAIGAVLGYAVSTIAGRHGLAPVWDLPAVVDLHLVDLGYAVVAGLTGALIAVAFTVAVRICVATAGRVGASARPMIGGILLGALALVSPYALTNGEWQIAGLAGTVAVGTLLLAAAAKLIAGAVAVAFGWRGGFIIPLFFIGFCVGRVVAEVLPGATEWAFVVSVMVAANVGVTKTPLGSTLVVTEMSGMAVLPSTLISALTCLVVTSPVGLIESQRERIDAYAGHR